MLTKTLIAATAVLMATLEDCSIAQNTGQTTITLKPLAAATIPDVMKMFYISDPVPGLWAFRDGFNQQSWSKLYEDHH